MKDKLFLAIQAAIAAGRKVIEIYDKDFTVDFKADDSPLTNADRESDLIIKSMLETEYPLISEESKVLPFEIRKGWNKSWLVDPLDGTKEFIKKNGEFTINIAFIVDGIPVLGVVYLPAQNTLYFASKDTGSYKYCIQDGEEISELSTLIERAKLLENATLPQRYTIVASRSHMSEETASFIDECRREYGEVNLISKGSSIKLCLVAERCAHVYPRIAPTMEWDTAAAHAVAKYAGCEVLDFYTGTELVYNKENLLNPFFIVTRKVSQEQSPMKDTLGIV